MWGTHDVYGKAYMYVCTQDCKRMTWLTRIHTCIQAYVHIYRCISLRQTMSCIIHTYIHTYIQVHFAEADNELHHLLIMESLGGNENFVDRFFAEHSAV